MASASTWQVTWQVTPTSTSLIAPDSSCGLQVCGIANPAFYQPRIQSVPRSGSAVPDTSNHPWGYGGAASGTVFVLLTIAIAVSRRWFLGRKLDHKKDEQNTPPQNHASGSGFSALIRRAAVFLCLGVVFGSIFAIAGPARAQIAPTPAPTCGAPIYKPCPTQPVQIGPAGSPEPTGSPLAPQPPGLSQVNITPVPKPLPWQQTECGSPSTLPAYQQSCPSFTRFLLGLFGIPDLTTTKQAEARAIQKQEVVERVLAHIPDVSHNDRVRQLWLIMVVFSDAALVLALPLGFFLAMHWDVTKIEWKAVAPRYVASLLTVNGSLWAVGEMTRWTNRITASMASAGVKADAITISKNLSFWLTTGIILVFVVLIISDLIRVALLLVGTVLAAPSQLAWMAFDNDAVARGWWGFMLYLFVSTIIQSILTVLATWVVYSGQPLFSASDSGFVIDTWILVVLILIIAIVPLVLMARGVKALGGHIRIRTVKGGPVAVSI